uniref:Uncharacterized protein n=1 Tax=Arundo donax TaxID=35708 RepID=A0A0A9HW15_ARUDO
MVMSLRYGRVIFLSTYGLFLANSDHSSRSILPSSFVSA